MRPSRYIIILLAASLLGGCAGKPIRFREEAALTLERVREQGGAQLLPTEFHNAQEAFVTGDALLTEGKRSEADRYFQLTLLKGRLLEQEVDEHKARQLEAQRIAEVLRRGEQARQVQQEADRLAQAKAAADQKGAEVVRRKARPAPPRERPLLSSYTVRRGESLPLIASQPEVYGDRNLWPLIYRANRDQIRDPRHIWPGQVLRIPRNTGRDDLSEARRYALERPLH